MTIAVTGNMIVDAAARKGLAASKKEAARAKSAAKKSSKGGKFKGAGRAGRAAACRAAKGIVAKRFNRKNSGKDTAKYGLKAGAELIACNCGYDIPTIATGLAPKMRPEIKDQIERLSFSTPASSGKATTEEWRKREEFIRREIGIDDSFNYCVSRHTDAEHDHIHLDFNRVSDEGKLWKDNQIGLRLAALEEKIEKRFALKLVAREDFITHGNISKKVVERAMREQMQPAFLQIQAAIQKAARDKPSVLTFISRLADQGISARPNMKQGELNGFGYKKDEQLFTGKQLGANWNQLREVVTYVKDEHASALADLKRNLDEGKSRPESSIDTKEPTAMPASGSEWQVERTQRSASSPTKKTSQQHTAASQPDRKSQTLPIRTSAAERLAELHARMDARRIKYKAIRTKLKVIPTTDHKLAESFAATLDPSLTEIEVAASFFRQHNASMPAIKMIDSHLNLTIDQRAALLMPYREQIKSKEAYNKRMGDAEVLYQNTESQHSSTKFDIPSM